MITASRDFVCVRPASYESESEAEVLTGFFRGRSGVLENTVFSLVAPDGETKLTRAGRSPSMVWDEPGEMADAMERLAKRYPATSAEEPAPLPTYANVRLALNVASCDSRPLVVIAVEDEQARTRLVERLAKLAWTEDFVGRLQYAVTASLADLEAIDDAPKEGGVLFVEADDYGLEGTARLAAKPDAKLDSLTALLREGLERFTPKTKDPRQHVRQAQRKGIRWESELPVTDPDERSARRGR